MALPGNESSVDVHLAHVVDDHRDPATLAVGQDVVEQGGFARAEEARQHGDGQLLRCGGWHGHRCP
jgi:hypothetical protein